MESLTDIVKILSQDSHLMGNRLEFVHSLGISETKVAPWIKLFDLGHCQPYDLIHAILSEWIVTREHSATVKELRRILSGINFNFCSDNLRELEEMFPGPIKFPVFKKSAEFDPFESPNPSTVEPKSIAFGITDVVVNFMGRDEELKRLNEYFHSRNCRSVLLSGLGGIGKTELAKKFTLNISDPSGRIVKSWLAGESSQTLRNSTTEFCHHLRLSATDSDGQPLGIHNMLKNILIKFKSSPELSRWLVIIDNVDEIHQEFLTALKTLFDFGSFVFLLVTSRRRDISTGEFLEVTEFKWQDSIKFIKNSLNTDKSSEDAILALSAQLGNFPLALSQAVAYIKQQQRQSLTGMAYGVQNYLDELAKKKTLGLDKDLEWGEYPKAALKVWHLTLDKIQKNHGPEGRTALKVLDIMAFIIADNIQTSILQKLFQRFYPIEKMDLNQIHSCLKILLQYSLISSCNSVISIHRLVQLALREKMASESTHHNKRNINLLKSFWSSFFSKDYNRDEIANVLVIWKHSCSQPELHEQIATKSYSLSEQLHDLGRVNESYDFATQCCQFLLDLYGPENKEYLLMVQRLAAALKQKGQFEASFEKLTFVYEKLKELCGEDDPRTLNTGSWIAGVLLYLNRQNALEESLEWGEKILRSKIRIYGESHESTMETKHEIALALSESGQGEKALEMYNEILEWREVHLGKDHRSTLATKHNIGVLFYFCKKYKKARGIFQKVLALREEHLGVDHPDTLNTKSLLSGCLEGMGEIDRALRIMEELAVARENVLGLDHPHTAFACYKIEVIENKLKRSYKREINGNCKRF